MIHWTGGARSGKPPKWPPQSPAEVQAAKRRYETKRVREFLPHWLEEDPGCHITLTVTKCIALTATCLLKVQPTCELMPLGIMKSQLTMWGHISSIVSKAHQRLGFIRHNLRGSPYKCSSGIQEPSKISAYMGPNIKEGRLQLLRDLHWAPLAVVLGIGLKNKIDSRFILSIN